MTRRRVPAIVVVACLGAAAFAISYWAIGAFPEQRDLMRTVAGVMLALGLVGIGWSRIRQGR